MPRKSSNQWDFGDLFTAAKTRPRDQENTSTSASTARRVYSVTEITLRVKTTIEQHVGVVWVTGEISNLRAQNSGHIYFTLKDSGAQLQCVLFRSTQPADRSALVDGRRVTLQGDLTVYEPRGQYQLIVRVVDVQGIGALQAAFERLKQRLNAEGLFAAERKRPIPRYPTRIGVVTSPTGAALRDVVHVLQRRHGRLELILVPCRVQGQGAEFEIAAALRRLNAYSAARHAQRLDVILVTRGGGSLEDLWAFNEEIVARAIVASTVPVVSAVGHEIDFTIADFVADLRAATPSAAAELLTAGYVEIREWVSGCFHRMRRLAEGESQRQRQKLATLARRLVRAHPRRRFLEQCQRLDDAEAALVARGRAIVQQWKQRLGTAAIRFQACQPRRRMAREVERVALQAGRLEAAATGMVHRHRERFERLALRLELLSPKQVLARGYSITWDAETGRVLRHAEETGPGRRLRTRLFTGELDSVIVYGETGKQEAE